MSLITKKFYNLFWQNKACQNLFLLSKEELLDTIVLPLGNADYSISMPRIILSNVQKENEFDLASLKIRSENNNLSTEKTINTNLKSFEPMLNIMIESDFGQSFEKLINDIEANPNKILRKGFTLFFRNHKKKEKIIIEFLQEYKFIGKHIKNYEDVLEHVDDYILSKKNVKSVLTEKNIWNFLEMFKSIKDIYTITSQKSLYNSNQILIGALHDNEDFASRSQLFHLLYESNIILPSNEDSFIECLDCEPGTYKGVLQVKINPKKLDKLKCPICQEKLTFYVPYRLHDDIYNIVKLKDGLLYDSCKRLLEHYKIMFDSNKVYLNDIEIDIEFNNSDILYLIECKMYKMNTQENKLENKIKRHFKKLIEDSKRINYNKIIHPILLVNLTDQTILNNIESNFEIEYNPDKLLTPRVMNIIQLDNFIASLN